MNKFYFYLHTLNNNFKRRFSITGLLFFSMLQVNSNAGAQCIFSNPSVTVTAPTAGNTVQINSCAFAGDYSTINSVAASTSYTVSSSVSTDYITIRQGTPGGAVIAFGITPLTWTSTSGGTYYMLVNSSYFCSYQASCRTTAITNNGSCTPPVVTVTPSVSCGSICNPLTASGADTYTWFPFAGLYRDCALTIPYTGENVSTVFAVPYSFTTYTVTGTNSATGCSGTATAIVNNVPPTPLVTPNPANMCLGDPPVKLKIVSPVTVQFCSGAVNLPVPDNNPAGVLSGIFAGIPPTATVTAMSVTVNMTHTRVGDMVFALKAPNGQVINLDYYLSGTLGTGLTTGFVNTVISSAGTNFISSSTNPYTGVFRADLQQAYPPGGPGPGGPTTGGMIPTANTWSALYSQPNGTWILGFYDGITGETGTLTSWCLSISYYCGSSVHATPAVWTPIAGLYSDAAGTLAYLGTPVDSVWAKPGIAGTFSYQVTTQSLPPNLPSCTSPPATVVVNVNQPATITTQPVDQNICLGNNAVFSVVAAGTTPLNYQWQVTVNGGASFTNLVNAAPYSGVNTATLTINSPPLSMSGTRYRVIINGTSLCGQAISNMALLTVNPLPAVVISANPTIILPGQTTTIHSTVTPNPGAVYTWYFNGAVVAGATDDSLVVDISGLGDYQLKVTDIYGCTGLSNIISITDHFAPGLFVYPNPTGGQFQARYFSEPNTVSARTLVVYNNRGDKVVTKSFTQTVSYQRVDIDLRPYGKGLYWVELVDANGKRLAMSRAVVQ